MQKKDLILVFVLFAVFSAVICPLIQDSMPFVLWFIWLLSTGATIGLAAYLGYRWRDK